MSYSTLFILFMWSMVRAVARWRRAASLLLLLLLLLLCGGAAVPGACLGLRGNACACQ
jgi:hypothetical protein